jgi:hypothetical protein
MTSPSVIVASTPAKRVVIAASAGKPRQCPASEVLLVVAEPSDTNFGSKGAMKNKKQLIINGGAM